MDSRRGNITVGALVGTGAATLAVAMVGLAGVGSDLRAADAVRTTPPLTTQQLNESLQQERDSTKWDGHRRSVRCDHDDLPSVTTPGTSATPAPSPTPAPTDSASHKEL